MAAPTITAISPATGSGDGGCAVLITGTGFSGASAVAFGAVPAISFTVQSSTSITATAPAQAAGVVRVKVTTPDGVSADTAGDDFTYAAPTAALCARAQVKARGGISDTNLDTQIDELIALALARFNASTGREAMPWVTEARTFRLRNDRVVLRGSDLRSATSVVLHPENEATTLVANTDYALVIDRLTNTAGAIQLGGGISLASGFSANFGYAQITVTGAWGIWEHLADVPVAVSAGAIECVLSWLNKPIQTVTGLDSFGARETVPGGSSTWDIPASAYRKWAPYTRHWGVY
jgi:hypothetical protein